MAERYTITGPAEISSTMQHAGRELEDMTPAHRSAAGIFAALARARAPRVTGALANATLPVATKEGAGIVNVLPYFGPIHYGWAERNIVAQPYVDEAVVDSEDRWLAVYEHAVKAAADSVRGA